MSKDGYLRLRPEVAAFAQAMERQLRANAHKGGWKHEDPEYLYLQARRNLMFLNNALLHKDLDSATERIGRRAANVANFVMMIADVTGCLALAGLSISQWPEEG